MYFNIFHIVIILLFIIIIRLQVWHVESIIRKLHVGSEDGSAAPDFKCHFTGSLSDSWQSPATPCSLIDSVVSYTL